MALPEIEVHDFRASGYLPEVLVNYLALLGWSPGDDREKMTLDEMCALFSLERVGRTDARFDRVKLLSFNTDACAAADPQRLLAAFRDYLAINADSPLSAQDDATLLRLAQMNAGFRTLRDVEEKSGMLFVPDGELHFDSDALRKVLLKGDGAGLAVLRELRGELAAAGDWSPEGLERLVRGAAEQRGLGLGKLAQPLRVAVTGVTVSPPLFDKLALLGAKRSLARIDRALSAAAALAAQGGSSQ